MEDRLRNTCWFVLVVSWLAASGGCKPEAPTPVEPVTHGADAIGTPPPKKAFRPDPEKDRAVRTVSPWACRVSINDKSSAA